MTQRNPADHELYVAQMAANEYSRLRLQDLPETYQLLLPVVAETAELVRYEEKIRTVFEQDLQEYLFDPWWQSSHKGKRFVEPLPKDEITKLVEAGPREDQTPDDFAAHGPRMPGGAPMIEEGLPHAIKLGYGVDPVDHEYKPFADFTAVAQARNEYRQSPLFKLRKEARRLWATVDGNGDFQNEADHKNFMRLQGEIRTLEGGKSPSKSDRDRYRELGVNVDIETGGEA